MSSLNSLLGDSVVPCQRVSRMPSVTASSVGAFRQRAYRSGDWKLIFVPEPSGGTGKYALYDLATDPGETRDVSAEYPEIVEELSGKWDQYAKDNGIVPAGFEAVNEAASAAQ